MQRHDMTALTIAAKCSDAYSADIFGPVLWVRAAEVLLEMGLDSEEAEAVLRSKWTRWCRDEVDGTAVGDTMYVESLYFMVRKSIEVCGKEQIRELIA